MNGTTMNNKEHCPYCNTPYSEERDEFGLPYCECGGAEIARLQAENEQVVALSALLVETCNAKVAALQEDVDRLSSLETALVGKAQELEREIDRLRAQIEAMKAWIPAWAIEEMDNQEEDEAWKNL